MYKKILEILKENYYPLGELDDDEQAAKNISDMFYDFVKWKDEYIRTYHHALEYDAINLYSIVSESKIVHVTLENLFEYWLKEIKK